MAPKIVKRLLCLFVFITHAMASGVAFFWSSCIVAQFSLNRRSINATGEVLPRHECELSVTHLACGASDTTMISAPTLIILTGRNDFEVKRKFLVSDKFRISPRLIAGSPVQFAGAIDLGGNFGDESQHSLNIGFEDRLLGKSSQPIQEDNALNEYRWRRIWMAEYDYYFSGQLSYIGHENGLIYFGITFGNGDWFYGAVTSPKSRYFPLPYVYVRF